MIVAVAVAVLRRIRRRADRSEPHTPARPRDPAALLLLLLAAAGGLAFAGLDLRYNFLWDGFAIWASKAQRLYVEGALTPTWYTGVTYDARYVSYPPAVPLYEALVGVLRGAVRLRGAEAALPGLLRLDGRLDVLRGARRGIGPARRRCRRDGRLRSGALHAIGRRRVRGHAPGGRRRGGGRRGAAPRRGRASVADRRSDDGEARGPDPRLARDRLPSRWRSLLGPRPIRRAPVVRGAAIVAALRRSFDSRTCAGSPCATTSTCSSPSGSPLRGSRRSRASASGRC